MAAVGGKEEDCFWLVQFVFLHGKSNLCHLSSLF